DKIDLAITPLDFPCRIYPWLLYSSHRQKQRVLHHHTPCGLLEVSHTKFAPVNQASISGLSPTQTVLEGADPRYQENGCLAQTIKLKVQRDRASQRILPFQGLSPYSTAGTCSMNTS